MMVCEIEDKMPVQELAKWMAYIEIENPFPVSERSLASKRRRKR